MLQLVGDCIGTLAAALSVITDPLLRFVGTGAGASLMRAAIPGTAVVALAMWQTAAR
jgi:hypothetical protein